MSGLFDDDARWFADLGFGVWVERVDDDAVSGEWWAHLTRAGSDDVVAPRYGRGDTEADAVRSARRRYEVEEFGAP
jgi:hypothetical protein